jgi:hypothetical protein
LRVKRLNSTGVREPFKAVFHADVEPPFTYCPQPRLLRNGFHTSAVRIAQATTALAHDCLIRAGCAAKYFSRLWQASSQRVVGFDGRPTGTTPVTTLQPFVGRIPHSAIDASSSGSGGRQLVHPSHPMGQPSNSHTVSSPP